MLLPFIDWRLIGVRLDLVGEPREQSLTLSAERRGAAELTEHPHDSKGDAVDEQVGGREVELHPRCCFAQVGEA